MERARVGIFEDDQIWQETLTKIVEHDGHTVSASATSMKQARKVIGALEEDSLDVALVDGNLRHGISRQEDGADGAEITRLLRHKFGSIAVIGVSTGGQIVGVDHNLSKYDDVSKDIRAIIKEI